MKYQSHENTKFCSEKNLKRIKRDDNNIIKRFISIQKRLNVKKRFKIFNFSKNPENPKFFLSVFRHGYASETPVSGG